MPTNLSPLQSLRTALASGATSTQAVASNAARHANQNASHNTYITPFNTESLQRAEQLPRLHPDPQSRPPLYGIPISLKDCFDLTGTVSTCGSRFYAQHNPIAQQNSWIAQRLLDAGAIVTGKTHLHQLAYGITGENADYGDCLQPRDATLLTGGSSSGAAASVQEGSALAAIGTDTGGSVRVPATLCGLVGYRTSHAFNSEALWSGGYHLAPTFDTLGILFRDLRDAPAFASALFNIAQVPAPAQIRIGFAGDDFVRDCDPSVLAAYEAWKQRLANHGATLSSFDTAFWSESTEIYSAIQASEAAVIHRGNFQHFEPVIAQRLTWGAAFSPVQLNSYRQRLEHFRNKMSTLFEQFNFLIAPATPLNKLYAGRDHTESRKALLRYTTPASLSGLPAIILAGEHIGAPLGTGVQLLAAPMQDAPLLAFASTFA